jgi:formylglycine-generating enzyme required for sulfatase activity
MVYVPAGTFIMGEDEEAHEVYLDAFWIDKTEVTNAQYRKCVEAGKCKAFRYADDPRFNGEAQPVVGVSWDDAVAYAQWVGGRLPTEAEWEKAARGTDGRVYPWGNEWDGRRLNFCDTKCEFDLSKDASVDDGFAWTAPVGSYPAGASPYGALDMAGNVWELVADWYDSSYYFRSPGYKPAGPDSGAYHVMRGGSWVDTQRFARVSCRGIPYPDLFDGYIGFRVVCAPGS